MSANSGAERCLIFAIFGLIPYVTLSSFRRMVPQQAPTNYLKGMSVFVHAKGGLMYEAAVGRQKFSL